MREALAERREIDFYDVAQALIGFQRSLAITTNLILNGTVITQAPSLKGAQILALPPEDGSWKFTTVVVATIFAAAQAPQNSLIGHLLTSAYDYVVSETLGFHIDFTKTLGQQYDEIRKSRIPLEHQSQNRFDSVIEKCQTAIRDMHRPIVWSETAHSATLSSQTDPRRVPLTPTLDRRSYEYMIFTLEENTPTEFIGRISSYNMNTYKGRIHVDSEGRTIPFELSELARSRGDISLITRSLALNADARTREDAYISCVGFRNTSRSGRLKSYRIIEVHEYAGGRG